MEVDVEISDDGWEPVGVFHLDTVSAAIGDQKPVRPPPSRQRDRKNPPDAATPWAPPPLDNDGGLDGGRKPGAHFPARIFALPLCLMGAKYPEWITVASGDDGFDIGGSHEGYYVNKRPARAMRG